MKKTKLETRKQVKKLITALKEKLNSDIAIDISQASWFDEDKIAYTLYINTHNPSHYFLHSWDELQETAINFLGRKES